MNMQLTASVKKNKFHLLALLVLLVYLSPNIFFPHKARYLVHDNLDSNVVWYKNLAESGSMFASSDTIIPNSLGGMPRGVYPSELNLEHLLYMLFSPLTAYNINSVLMHLLAFFSMYILLRRYILGKEREAAAVMVSLLFALLPFWPSGGAAITAQPLLLYAFLNILHKDLSWKNWLIILLVPFYSVLALSNLFFISLLFFAFLIYMIYRKKWNVYVFLAFALFTMVSVVAEYRLFYMQFVAHFQNHRNVAASIGVLNWKGLIGVSLLHFLKGHYHFFSMQSPFILLFAVLALLFAKGWRDRFVLLGMLLFIYFVSVLYVASAWEPVARKLADSALLGSLTMRFYSLFPLLWFLVLAYAVRVLLDSKKNVLRYSVWALCVAFCVSLFFSFNAKDYFNNSFAENTFYNTFVNSGRKESASFDEHYRADVFNDVKAALPPGKYYVACLGMEPEVAQFNGYNTIDGYFYYYAKSYNELICSISAREMEKSGTKRIGSHCVLVCDDIKKGKKVIDNLELDFEKMKSIGTRYLFSDRKIISQNLTGEQYFKGKYGQLFIYTLQ
jgi:hypothetical protein